jgi:hypothetical protein
LNDDVLTGFQHFADELRTARRTRMTMTTIVARATGTARTAFESRTAAGTSATITTAIGTASTAVRAAAAAPVASTALRALETGARIAAADSGGITRKVFARCGSATDARGPGFARKQDHVIFDGGRSRCDFSRMSFD